MNVDIDKLRMLGIRIIHGSLNTTPEFQNRPVPAHSFNFEFRDEAAHNMQERKSRLRLYFNIEGQDKEGNSIGLNADYTLEYFYYVENLPDYFDKDGYVDGDFLANLIGIAYSTARGILLERTQGTYFNGIVLPIINSSKFLREGEKDN